MKPVFVSILVLAFVALCNAVSQPVIPDTRTKGCIDGVCNDHCGWDGVKIFPSESLNQPGKCRMLHCASNFDIRITPCPFDMTNQYEWINKDNTKLYPECCGTKTKKSG